MLTTIEPYIREIIQALSWLFLKVSLEVICIFLWGIDVKPPAVPLGTIIQLLFDFVKWNMMTNCRIYKKPKNIAWQNPISCV